MMQHNGDWAYGQLMKAFALQYYELGVCGDNPLSKETICFNFKKKKLLAAFKF